MGATKSVTKGETKAMAKAATGMIATGVVADSVQPPTGRAGGHRFFEAANAGHRHFFVRAAMVARNQCETTGPGWQGVQIGRSIV